jgi:hypothetical protein
MTDHQLDALAHARWRISSYSDNGAGCVELATVDQATAVRDSKHPTGPALVFERTTFAGFLTAAPDLDDPSMRHCRTA